MNLYAASYVALSNTKHTIQTAVLIAENDDEVYGRIYQLAQKECPPAEGWYAPAISIVRVPMETIQAFLKFTPPPPPPDAPDAPNAGDCDAKGVTQA